VPGEGEDGSSALVPLSRLHAPVLTAARTASPAPSPRRVRPSFMPVTNVTTATLVGFRRPRSDHSPLRRWRLLQPGSASLFVAPRLGEVPFSSARGQGPGPVNREPFNVYRPVRSDLCSRFEHFHSPQNSCKSAESGALIPSLQRVPAVFARCLIRHVYDGNVLRMGRADARTRTGDPFITRERRVRDGRPRAGTDGHVLAGDWAVLEFGKWTAVPALARADVPVLYPAARLPRWLSAMW
jgi:hypothetical protein